MTRVHSRDRCFIYRFPCPVYTISVVGKDTLVTAGGGGAARTGVPNKVDLVHIERRLTKSFEVGHRSAPLHVSAKVVGGADTGSEAVMNLASVSCGAGAFIISLEGKHCVEYLAYPDDGTPVYSTRVIPTDKVHLTTASNHILDVKSREAADDDREIFLRQRKNSTRCSVSEDLNDSPIAEAPSETRPTPQQDASTGTWSLTPVRRMTISLRSSTFSSNTDVTLPTCVDISGPGGTCSWLAVGTDKGALWLVDRLKISCSETAHDLGEMKPSCIIPDVSGGSCAGVCSLAFAPFDSSFQTSAPLLATVCEQPSGDVVRVWTITDKQSAMKSEEAVGNHHPTPPPTRRRFKSGSGVISRRRTSSTSSNHSVTTIVEADETSTDSWVPKIYARADASLLTPCTQLDQSKMKTKSKTSMRFKHCRFLKCLVRCPPSTQKKPDDSMTKLPCIVLVTTVQPVPATRQSVSRLVTWLVPPIVSTCEQQQQQEMSNGKLLDGGEPTSLQPFAQHILPQGHLPACIAVHPSRTRGLIAVGTMEGQVDVYLLLSCQPSLVRLYSLQAAHPIFVTALAFLPPTRSTDGSGRSDFFELVSVSVDRMLRWHPGPSYYQVLHLQDAELQEYSRRRTYKLTRFLTSLGSILFLLFLPVWLCCLDRLMGVF